MPWKTTGFARGVVIVVILSAAWPLPSRAAADATAATGPTTAPGRLTPQERDKLLAEARELNGKVMDLYDHGQFAQAIPMARELVRIATQVLGERHPDYANALNVLAPLYKRLGDYTGAEPLYREQIQIDKEALGSGTRAMPSI